MRRRTGMAGTMSIRPPWRSCSFPWRSRAPAVLLAGTLVHAWSLLRMVTHKMREIGLRIVIYREIVQIVEKEIRGRN